MAEEQFPTALVAGEPGSSPLRKIDIVGRVLTSLLGSYVFVWGFVSFVIALGVKVLSFSDARTLAFLLAFLVFLASFCWVFVAKSLLRVWGVLLGGGGFLTGAAWLLTRGAP